MKKITATILFTCVISITNCHAQFLDKLKKQALEKINAKTDSLKIKLDSRLDNKIDQLTNESLNKLDAKITLNKDSMRSSIATQDAIKNTFITSYYKSVPEENTNIPNKNGILVFIDNTALIAESSMPILETIATKINKQTEVLQIVVYSHDTNKDALQLSIDRANAIKTFLVDNYNCDEAKLQVLSVPNNNEKKYKPSKNGIYKIEFIKAI